MLQHIYKVPCHSLLPVFGEEVVKELDLLEGLAKVRKALQGGVVGNQNLRVSDGVLQELLFLLVKVPLHGMSKTHKTKQQYKRIAIQLQTKHERVP